MSEKRMTITGDHLKLLAEMHVGWEDCEYGAPAVDPKRPYGNSDVARDMAEILGLVKGRASLDSSVREHMRRLHHEMQDVLQVLVQHAGRGVNAGETYERADYKHWARVSP